MPSSNFLEYSSWKNVRSLFTFTFYKTGTISAFAPYLLDKKAEKIRKTIVLEKKPYKFVRTVFDTKDRSWVFLSSLYYFILTFTPLNLDGKIFLLKHRRDPSNYLLKNQSSKFWESIWLLSTVFSIVCLYAPTSLWSFLTPDFPQSPWLFCQTYLSTSTMTRQASQAYTTSRLVLGSRHRLYSMYYSWIVSTYTTRTRKVALESPSIDCVS